MLPRLVIFSIALLGLDDLHAATTWTKTNKCFAQEKSSGGSYRYKISIPCEIVIPPIQTQDYTGMEKIFINPSYTIPNDCTYLKVDFIQKLEDGNYQIKQSVHDAAQYTNGQRTCPYKQ